MCWLVNLCDDDQWFYVVVQKTQVVMKIMWSDVLVLYKFIFKNNNKNNNQSIEKNNSQIMSWWGGKL